jgi:type II secretory ATPase GspE/PulE/Tfp pilus assembly ATPase PilB-like protein
LRKSSGATTDIEIKPGEEVVVVRIREDGVLIARNRHNTAICM